MATKYEIYQAHPPKDAYDTEPAILHLSQAKEWLSEALPLAQKGDIEALLRYFQVGYTSGNWHFPTIATHYAHGIGHRLAKLLEEELLQGTQFHFKYSTTAPQNFVLYHHADEGHTVAHINIWNREIDLSIDFEEQLRRLNARRLEYQREISNAQGDLKEDRQWLDKYSRRPWIQLFEHWKDSPIIRWRYRDRLTWMENRLKDRAAHVESMKKWLADINTEEVNLKRVEIDLKELSRFEKYGFSIHPTSSIQNVDGEQS